MKPNNTSVLLIYTGGTIGMFENPETGALENFDFGHLLLQLLEVEILQRTGFGIFEHADGATGIN